MSSNFGNAMDRDRGGARDEAMEGRNLGLDELISSLFAFYDDL